MAAIPETGSVGTVIIRIPARPVTKASGAIYVIPVVPLVGAHEVGGAVGIPVLRPVAPVRVNSRHVGAVVVVHVPPYCESIIPLLCGAQGAMIGAPGGGVVQGADSAVGGAGIHVRVASSIVIATQHRCRGCRAAVAPVKSRHVAKGVSPHGNIGLWHLHYLGFHFRRSPRDADRDYLPPLFVNKCLNQVWIPPAVAIIRPGSFCGQTSRGRKDQDKADDYRQPPLFDVEYALTHVYTSHFCDISYHGLTMSQPVHTFILIR